MAPVLAILAVAPAVAGPASQAPAAAALDGPAAALVDKLWAASLRTCGDQAFYDLGRAVIQLDRPIFRLAPTRLTEAARASGYDFQTTAVAAAPRWRWAPRRGGGVGRWSAWREGQTVDVRLDEFGIGREHAAMEDAVLQFDLVRQNGRWSAFRPLSPLNSTPLAVDPQVPPATTAPSCARLLSRR